MERGLGEDDRLAVRTTEYVGDAIAGVGVDAPWTFPAHDQHHRWQGHRLVRHGQLLDLTAADQARGQSGKATCTSRGAGAPSPVSTIDFRLIRKVAHLVLQWCMNSTGSFQPWCLNSTIV